MHDTTVEIYINIYREMVGTLCVILILKLYMTNVI